MRARHNWPRVHQGCGFQGRVQSPSFGLINVYEGGNYVVHHLDLYRLESKEEIRGAGLEEYLNGEAGVVVEWASRWFDQEQELPKEFFAGCEYGRKTKHGG